MHQAASGVQFPSRKRTEIRQSPGRARPAGRARTFGASAGQIAPARPRCPTLLWDITITAPRAALAHENGLTAAANPWGCPPPGGGCASLRAPRAVPQASKMRVVVVDASRRRAQPRAPILCPPIGMLERRRSRSAQGRATRDNVLRDGHQCLLFHGYQSLNTLAAAPERDAGQVD